MRSLILATLLLCAINVSAQTITQQPVSQTVQAGQSASFTVTVSGGPCRSLWLINGAGTYGPMASTFTYTVSKAALSQNGMTVQIQIYGCPAPGSSVSAKAILTVTAAAPVLQSITIAPLNPTIGVGQTQAFDAVGTYSDGSTQDLTNTATWTSVLLTAATISSSGIATGVAPGISVIEVASGPINASTALSVLPVLNITFTPANDDGSTPNAQLAVSSITTNPDGSTTANGVLQLASGNGVLPYSSTLLYEAVFYLNGTVIGQPTVFSPTLLTAVMPHPVQMSFSAVMCVTTCSAGTPKSMSWSVSQ